jgi:PST family polysaccharide transporter
MFSRLLGPHATGMYSLAYNLSDLPATYVGEHVATALFPTMAQIEPERRNEVFCRSCGLLALIVLPMAVGLASISATLVQLLLPPDWQGVSDFLLVVSLVAIFRPINAVISSLLIATERNRTLMLAEFLKIIALLGGMWYLSRFGGVAAAAAIGLAMAAQTIGLIAVMARNGFPAGRLLAEFRGPALAAAFIAFAVLAVRHLFQVFPAAPLLVRLVAEIAAGALAYFLGVLLFARPTLSRLVDIVRHQLGRASKPNLASRPT